MLTDSFSCLDNLCFLLSVGCFQFADSAVHVPEWIFAPEPKLITFWSVYKQLKTWREEEEEKTRWRSTRRITALLNWLLWCAQRVCYYLCSPTLIQKNYKDRFQLRQSIHCFHCKGCRVSALDYSNDVHPSHYCCPSPKADVLRVFSYLASSCWLNLISSNSDIHPQWRK